MPQIKHYVLDGFAHYKQIRFSRSCSVSLNYDLVVKTHRRVNGSEFIGLAYKTGQFAEVKRAYRKAKTLHPSADHIIAAYNLKTVSGHQNDGEIGGGYKLLQYLKQNKPLNTVVFVVRYRNGGNIGATRFELLEQVAEQATQRLR